MSVLQKQQMPEELRAERIVVAEESQIRTWIIPVALVIVPLLVLFCYDYTRFPGLTNLDALDFAQLGRNLSAGKGFVTYALKPLALTHGANPLQQPDLTHGPLYPFLLALGFGAAGVRDEVVAGISGLFYLLTIPILYLLAVRVFNRTVGYLTVAVFAFSTLILEYASSGTPVTLSIFLTTALFLVLYNLADRKKTIEDLSPPKLATGTLILAGALTGLMYLTDPIFFWLIPVVTGIVIRLGSPRRLTATMAFLTPLCLLVFPWMLRNGILTGNPIFGLRGLELWMNTRKHYPGQSAYRLFPGELTTGTELLGAVFKKMLLGLNSVIQSLPQICASWVLAFLLPTLLFSYQRQAPLILRRVVLTCFLALLFGMLLFQIEMPLLVAFVPTMLVFAIAGLVYLTNLVQLPRSSQALLATLLGLTIVYPFMSQIFLEEKLQQLPEERTAQALEKATTPSDVILTDQPQVVAWYAHRPAILIPASDAKVAEVTKQFNGIHWLFLTPRVRGYSPQWQYVYEQFQAWNTLYLNATEANQKALTPVQISGIDHPLFKALEGFTSVRPVPGTASSIVVAILPPGGGDTPPRQ